MKILILIFYVRRYWIIFLRGSKPHVYEHFVFSMKIAFKFPFVILRNEESSKGDKWTCRVAMHIEKDSSFLRMTNLFNYASFLSREIFVLIKVFSPAHCRGDYYFFLDKKVAKNQDGKNLLTARPTPGPVFRRAFARFFDCPLIPLFVIPNLFRDPIC